jgi:hypothetical protein
MEDQSKFELHEGDHVPPGQHGLVAVRGSQSSPKRLSLGRTRSGLRHSPSESRKRDSGLTRTRHASMRRKTRGLQLIPKRDPFADQEIIGRSISPMNNTFARNGMGPRINEVDRLQTLISNAFTTKIAVDDEAPSDEAILAAFIFMIVLITIGIGLFTQFGPLNQ